MTRPRPGHRALVTLAALALLLFTTTAHAASRAEKRAGEIRKIAHLRAKTWHWQLVMHVHRTPTSYDERHTRSTAYRAYLVRHWQREARRARNAARHVPDLGAWLCIHHGEGAWSSNTGNGYYGGLQMDYSFMRTYGGYLLNTKGTADRWSPVEQLWTAEYARRSGRGFFPWPLTARACRLI